MIKRVPPDFRGGTLFVAAKAVKRLVRRAGWELLETGNMVTAFLQQVFGQVLPMG